MNEDARFLLARLTARQEEISRDRHGLALEDRVVQECITRLRTGEAVSLVEARLLAFEARV